MDAHVNFECRECRDIFFRQGNRGVCAGNLEGRSRRGKTRQCALGARGIAADSGLEIRRVTLDEADFIPDLAFHRLKVNRAIVNLHEIKDAFFPQRQVERHVRLYEQHVVGRKLPWIGLFYKIFEPLLNRQVVSVQCAGISFIPRIGHLNGKYGGPLLWVNKALLKYR